jgi:hypothetical protein
MIPPVPYFAGRLTRRQPGHPSVIDGFHVDLIIEAMAQSSRRQARIDLAGRGL